MGKELHNGIMMEQTFLMIDEKKTGLQLSTRMIQFLAIIIGSWSFASILTECIVIPLDVLQINAVILIFAGILFALFLVPSYHLVKLFFALLFYLLFLISRFPRLCNGFYIIENLVLRRAAVYYNYNSIQFEADYTTQTADTTLLVAMVLIPMIALLTISIVKNRFIHLSCLFLFLPVSASFLLGLIPSEKYLIAYIGIILYLARSGFPFRNIKNREQLSLLHRINSRSAVCLSLIGLTLYFILQLFVTDERYNKVTDIKEMKKKVQSAAWDYSLEDFERWFSNITLFGGSSKATGGLSGGKLGKVAEVKYNESEQLLLTVPVESAREGLYLKGYVGSVYTGSSWEEHSKEERKKYRELTDLIPSKEFQPVNQNVLLLKQILDSMRVVNSSNVSIYVGGESLLLSKYSVFQGNCRVEYKEASKKYIYAPYFTDFEQLGQGYYVQDLYLAPRSKKREYKFDYFFNVFNSPVPFIKLDKASLTKYSENEKRYRDYVYKVYTELPEKGLEELKRDFAIQRKQNLDMDDKLTYVESYLKDNTTYTLSPGKLPEGEDFVEYFLFQNKKGYCAHYASAAVLMLRAMGVPARYVEGYRVGPSEDTDKLTGEEQVISAYTGNESVKQNTQMKQISVKDSNAHAWTEVYIDNYGWLPMDFTPGSSNQNETVYYSLFTNDRNKEVDQTYSAPTPPINYSDMDKDMNRNTNNNIQKASSKEQTKLNVIFMIAFMVLFISFVSATLLFKVIKRRRYQNAHNPNKRALFFIMEVEKILSVYPNGLTRKGMRLEDVQEYVVEKSPFIEAKAFEACMETARKARFGKGRISANELEEVKAFRHKLYREVYRQLSFIKKIYLSYLLLMEI